MSLFHLKLDFADSILWIWFDQNVEHEKHKKKKN